MFKIFARFCHDFFSVQLWYKTIGTDLVCICRVLDALGSATLSLLSYLVAQAHRVLSERVGAFAIFL